MTRLDDGFWGADLCWLLRAKAAVTLQERERKQKVEDTDGTTEGRGCKTHDRGLRSTRDVRITLSRKLQREEDDVLHV
jgi:hypothetical protein